MRIAANGTRKEVRRYLGYDISLFLSDVVSLTTNLQHHSRTHQDDEWDNLQPFGQTEEVVPFERPEHKKVLKGEICTTIKPSMLKGASNVPYRAWQACWALETVRLDSRLQFQREHQAFAPQNPGEPGVVYVLGWLKQPDAGSFAVMVKTGKDSWTFCGRYKAELVDVFKPHVWDAESEDVSLFFRNPWPLRLTWNIDFASKTKISWARYFEGKIGIRDQLACTRLHIALRDREEPSREKCEREIARHHKFAPPTAGDILRAWKHRLAVGPTLQSC